MALDPRLAPGGVKELRHDRGRRCARPASASSSISSSTIPVKATGSARRCPCAGSTTSPTIATPPTDRAILSTTPAAATPSPATILSSRRLILDSLRHFVRRMPVSTASVSTSPQSSAATRPGSIANGRLFEAIQADPVLADRVLIAEPWDIGPGGYQLGNFPDTFLEWNDRAATMSACSGAAIRDVLGALPPRSAGSSDIFGRWRRRRAPAASTSSPPMTVSPLRTSSPIAASTTRPTARRIATGTTTTIRGTTASEGETSDPDHPRRAPGAM